MPGKILCLDINEDLITAIVVKSGFNRYEVKACAQVEDEENKALDEPFKSLFAQVDPGCDTCLLSIPGGNAFYRNLHVPFHDPKKIRQVLPFEIETMVPFPIEDLLVDFTVFDRAEGSGLLAASIRKALVSEYLGLLQTYGIDPERVDIHCVPTLCSVLKHEDTPSDGLLLDVGIKKSTMLLYTNKRLALVRHFSLDGEIPTGKFPDITLWENINRSDTEKIKSALERLGRSVNTTIHAFRWQEKRNIRPQKIFLTGTLTTYPEAWEILERLLGIPVERVDLRHDRRVRMNGRIADAWNAGSMDHALALVLRDERRTPGFNFRKGEFAIQKRYLGLMKELRAAAILLAILLALLIVDFGVDYHLLKKRYTLLDQNIRQVFQQTFPDVRRIVNPLQQMKVRIKEIRKAALMMPGAGTGERAIDILKDISKRVPTTMDVHVARTVIDPEMVEVRGDTDTFKTVDSLKTRLEPSPYFSSVTITSANLSRKGKRVRFVLKLKRKKTSSQARISGSSG
ncbi:MAG: PilN domain-containing protein [Deltaproteobacteria bacterium]|nr:PilN domain-containing protein [Deltaproteobacteria bacterium]